MGRAPDLGAVLDQHLASELVDEDVDATMQTMSDEPYIWHVPSMAGGVGHTGVREFYATQFIGRVPGDIEMHAISRTVASDRVVEEFVAEFNHDIEMLWMLPGVAPTGRTVRIPVVMVIGFEGASVAHEHIY